MAACVGARAQGAGTEEPLGDGAAGRHYRTTVRHPAGTIRPEDIARAQENLRRYEWARAYARGLQHNADAWLDRLSPEWIVAMIPATTPGDRLFTPCPACRDLNKPSHPHGQYRWDATKPDEMTCEVCGTVFPSDRYPEDKVFTTRNGQKLSFYGGPAFTLFGFQTRPSFTANLRARKVAEAANGCRILAEAYALTGRPAYGHGARQLLLRFADVYPAWLVHVGYGEYADTDPQVAALRIGNLPEDEITPAPGGPDRALHSGYWQGGRATGTGMEAGFVRQMVEAYSFVCFTPEGGAPILTEPERLKIEKDLLLESTALLVADKAVNNKSVGNATAVALVGMALGHPGMVRFGLDVFLKTVDGWFLTDGGPSESWSYAMMTLGGIEALGQAFRGYSDPPGYKDSSGRRIDDFNLYRDTAYARVWQALFNGMQGDLNHPPLADSNQKTGLDKHFAEILAANYPDHVPYVALLKELAGPDLSGGDARAAIYWRPPGLEEKPTAPLALPDILFPALQIGYLRSGETGRDSCLVLSASDWGNHHHRDSLGLYFWQGGEELLGDLGYLWDHPMKPKTFRTAAHNTVMVDGGEQREDGRGGTFTLFSPRGTMKVMEAESSAYPGATLYRRTVTQVEHGPGQLYVMDIFRVHGGRTHQYVFHGPCPPQDLATPEREAAEGPPGLDLERVSGSSATGEWRVTWKQGKGRFRALWLNAPGETSRIGDGWGQRDERGSDAGALLPYIVRERANGTEPSVFVTVFEGSTEGGDIVRNLRRLEVPKALAGDVVAVAVDTPEGTDYFVSSLRPVEVKLDTPQGVLVVNGRFGAVSVRQGKIAATSAVDGTVLSLGGNTGP
jgi:hypothetical protein